MKTRTVNRRGRRWVTFAREGREAISGPGAAVTLFRREFARCDREHFLALLLDARNCPLAIETISIGCLDASLVHPRELFRAAVQVGAAAVILAHNHPSGMSRPSGDDIRLTDRLVRAGTVLGINVIDHLVIGHEEWTSLGEEGLMPNKAYGEDDDS